MSGAPSPNGDNGRDAGGRFTSGNAGGPGNPHAQHVGRLRSALLAAVSEQDMQAVIAKLIDMAKAGDVQAIREVFNRTIGKPVEADLIERIEQLEQTLAKKD